MPRGEIYFPHSADMKEENGKTDWQEVPTLFRQVTLGTSIESTGGRTGINLLEAENPDLKIDYSIDYPILEPTDYDSAKFHFALSGDFDNLPPRVDLEIFTLSRVFDNLSPSVDLEIFAPLEDLENLSLRMDLEIFTLSRDFDNLSQYWT
ncbi:hypothetical protein HZH68_013696 [Vespula germanica]|uniref:Uncharacterized protein n=1 Tax=Vespula germanica TaxID=30212 RepID=A0A834JB45_VESGE|nr:hypothetical protein HZH68_013696 [Vespula germanica]